MIDSQGEGIYYGEAYGIGDAPHSDPPVPPIPENAPIVGSFWKHWKGAKVLVLSVGRHSETKEILVGYTYKGWIWYRPLSMWSDQARPGIQRFTPVTSSFASFNI